MSNYSDRTYQTKSLAISGALLALSAVTLFFVSFVPGIELTLYLFSSFYVSVVILELDVKWGAAFYAASCLLGFFLMVNKLALLPYVFFFGLFGIAKHCIEKIGRKWLQYILKLLFFNTMIFAGLFFFKESFLGNISLPDFPWQILILLAQAALLAYDYIYTLLEEFYKKRFYRKGFGI